MEVLRAAILDMLRRKKGEPFTSSEVVRQMFPEDWEQFLEDVNRESMELYQEGLINVSDNEQQTISGSDIANSLKISSPNKL